MVVTRKYLLFIFITILYQDMINSVKQTKCQRVLHYVTERTNMECRSDEVIYVKKQAITSGFVSVSDEEKSCAANLDKGACTRSLPLNSSINDWTPFIVGSSCNLKNTCVLNKDLLYKTFNLFNKSCSTETTHVNSWTKDSIFTSFTYICIPKNHLLDFSGNKWNTSKTLRDVHLVTDGFYGNITCEMKGKINLLSLLELSEASFNLYRDEEKMYSNDNRNVHDTNVTLNNDFNTSSTRYIIKIYTGLEGRVWIHLKGNLDIKCSKISELHTLTSVDTDKNLTTTDTSRNAVRSKDLKFHTRLFLLLIVGLMVALTLMIGVYLLQRRKDKQKLHKLFLPTDRISINFTEHVPETSVDTATEEGNTYSEISSTRGHLLCFGNCTQNIN